MRNLKRLASAMAGLGLCVGIVLGSAPTASADTGSCAGYGSEVQIATTYNLAWPVPVDFRIDGSSGMIGWSSGTFHVETLSPPWTYHGTLNKFVASSGGARADDQVVMPPGFGNILLVACPLSAKWTTK